MLKQQFNNTINNLKGLKDDANDGLFVPSTVRHEHEICLDLWVGWAKVFDFALAQSRYDASTG